MSGLEFKRGDTMLLTGVAPRQSGGYAGWSLFSQVRKWGPEQVPGELIADLVCEWTDPAEGRMTMASNGPTINWPLGPAVFDLRYVSPDGSRTTTRYIKFEIIEPSTRV